MIREFRGKRPRIHPTVFIAEDALVLGDVEIGEGSSVWFGAIVRGDVHFIRIGARTNVQDGSVLHVTRERYPLVIGSDVTIGHRVTVHGCVVRDRCLIGMGATILDGAEVGEESVIAAGSLVPEGMRVPPRSVVMGLPGRVARAIRDADLNRIHRHAADYVKLAEEYRAGGKG